jgi:hypothetical protein
MRLSVILLLSALAASAVRADEPPALPDLLKSALSAVKSGQASSAESDPRCEIILGTWRGFGLDHIDVSAKGKIASKSGPGSWTCSDPKVRKFSLDVAGLGRAVVTLDPRGTRASGKLANGHLISATKDGPPPPAQKKAATAAAGTDCATIIGRYLWADGSKVTLAADGSALSDRAPAGRWRCLDAKAQKIAVSFGTGLEAILTGTVDHTQIEGKDPSGWPISARRQP